MNWHMCDQCGCYLDPGEGRKCDECQQENERLLAMKRRMEYMLVLHGDQFEMNMEDLVYGDNRFSGTANQRGNKI